ncbi:Scr1 family TA system antitoxin-like transcriptional regulator [Streptomyces sp. NPDC059835]|uniref:helix-turn-helix domain-containing protein n=1 Tax=Streptomyces sp. NPDC059835 TaxID=3346967 RepID=UPI0036460785
MPQVPNQLSPDKSVRHLFGSKMRAFREAAGWPLKRLHEEVRLSVSHLSRIENAEAMPPPELPALLDKAFGTDGIFAELYRVASHERHPDQFQRRMDLEARARALREYSGQIVPGLLQTEAYAEAQFRTYNPRATEAEIAKLVADRLARQTLLVGPGAPEYAIILDQGVLQRGFGGAAVWKRQLESLAAATLTATGVVRILPFSHGGHALMGGSLTLMTLGDGSQVAYEESITTGTLLEESHVVLDRERTYDRLAAHAWSPARTTDYIHSLMEAQPNEHPPQPA